VVQRGDTLWDIAGRFLQKPWLWPEIWQANPQIQNPHLIYPGDVVSLAYLDRVVAQVQPGPRDEAPIGAIPLDAVKPFLKDMRVVDDYRDLPYVVALEEDRLRSGQGQLAYASNLNAVPGARYAIVRPVRRYTHRDRTDACCDLFHARDIENGGGGQVFRDSADFWEDVEIPDDGKDFLGYEMMQVANAVVTRGTGNGIEAATLLVEDGSKEVRAGDRIVPAGDEGYDLQFFPHAPAGQLEYGRAKVLAVSDMLTSGGPHDVVTLSVGAREGVDNGTVFSVWRVGSNVVDRVANPDATDGWISTNARVRLPDEFAGHVMVFRTFERVSYALVMDGVKPTRVGYELKQPDATY
jgi:hypothetical protein